MSTMEPNPLADAQNKLRDMERRWKGGKPPLKVRAEMTELRFEISRLANLPASNGPPP